MNRLAVAGGTGDTTVTVVNADRTRVSRNEATGFGTFLDDAGTETKVSKNTCDGVASP